MTGQHVLHFALPNYLGERDGPISGLRKFQRVTLAQETVGNEQEERGSAITEYFMSCYVLPDRHRLPRDISGPHGEAKSS